MAILSIITSIYRPVPEYLLRAYESLRAQRLPPGWDWEWILQEDGETTAAQAVLPDDPRIRFGNGRHATVALTRNLALARSRGSLIKNLDGDDLLTDGVLHRDVTVLDAQPDVSWTTSRVLDLLPDGSTEGFAGDPPPGRLEPGAVHEYWRTHDYRSSVHATTLCIRRSLIVAMGGWMAIPGSDDTGLLVPASAVSTGWFHSEVGLLYRKWPGQVTSAAAHWDRVERTLRMELIDERAQALRRWLDPDAV